jgi:hypothetical protein
MLDVLFVLLTLALFFLLGLPCAGLLPAAVRGRALSAPLFGFAVFAIGVTVLYRAGVSPRMVAGGAVVVACLPGGAAAAWWLREMKQRLRPGLGFAVLTLAAVLLGLAPAWIGGPQFAAVQGNPAEHFAQLAAAAAFRTHSYAGLGGFGMEGLGLDDFRMGAMAPAASLVLAALGPVFYDALPEAAYAYLVLLQVLMLFAAAFALRAVFGVSQAVAGLLAAALAMGYFLQIVLDLNAWSQLAAMPMAFLAMTLAVLALGRDGFPGLLVLAVGRIAVLVGLAGAAVLYLDPQAIGVYAPALAAAVAAALVAAPPEPARSRRQVAARALAVALGAGLAVAAGLACPDGTLAVLPQQLADALFHLSPAEGVVIQGPLTGRDVPYRELYASGAWATMAWPELAYAAFSLPIDVTMGLTGLFWTLPDATRSEAGGSEATRSEAGAGPARFHAALGGGLAVPVLLLLAGRVGAAALALSLAGPLLFLLLAAPLMSGPLAARPLAVWLWRLAPGALVAGQLILALARPLAATQPDGIHYPPPYPAVPSAATKTGLSWDVARWKPVLRDCRRIAVDIGEPWLDRYTRLLLSDLRLPWAAATAAAAAEAGDSGAGAAPRAAPRADCLVTTRLTHAGPWQTVVWLDRDRRVHDFHLGVTRSLEVGLDSPPLVIQSGLAAVTPGPAGPRRWTDGAARIELPDNPQDPARALTLVLDAPADGASLRLVVNDAPLYEGPLPAGPWSRRFELPATSAAAGTGALVIGLDGPGVALSRLTLEK